MNTWWHPKLFTPHWRAWRRICQLLCLVLQAETRPHWSVWWAGPMCLPGRAGEAWRALSGRGQPGTWRRGRKGLYFILTCHHVYNHKVLPNFLKKVIFLPLSRSYIFRSRSNLMTPSYFGLQNAVNFYIPVNDEDAVGKVKSKKTRPDLILLLSQGLGTYGPQMVLLLWKVWPQIKL